MTCRDTRPNWLSEIIQEQRRDAERPTPLSKRKVQRDQIVAAIQAHPEGQALAGLAGLADAVWAALGIAHNVEQEAAANPDSPPGEPSVQASLFLLDMDRTAAD